AAVPAHPSREPRPNPPVRISFASRRSSLCRFAAERRSRAALSPRVPTAPSLGPCLPPHSCRSHRRLSLPNLSLSQHVHTVVRRDAVVVPTSAGRREPRVRRG
ncbi:unnamed protein product, partial [Ixodes pacificus]